MPHIQQVTKIDQSDKRIYAFYDSNRRAIGYLVIHSLINGRSSGGIRMVPDLSLEELLDLAYFMTLKFTFLGIKMGGAKGGIIGNADGDISEKEILLKNYGEALSPLLKIRQYIPGVDLGTEVKDIESIVKASGVGKISDLKHNVKSGEATAFTVFTAMQEACQFISLPLSSSKIGIEGFGSVGSSLAQLLSKTGALVIAVSTEYGNVIDHKGLNVDDLIALYNKFGNKCVLEYKNAEFSESTSLATLPLDIYAPCSRLYSIDEDNICDIKAKLICGGSNLQILSGIESILREKEILYVPSFLANCGGILFGSMQKMGLNYEYFKNTVNSRYRLSIRNLLEKSKTENLPPVSITTREVEKRFLLFKSEIEYNKFSKYLFKFGQFWNESCLTPKIIKQYIGRKQANKILTDW